MMSVSDREERKNRVRQQLHDLLFRFVYSHKEYCPDILRLVLTGEELRLFDLSTLKMEMNTLVDGGKEKRMDLTLSVHTRKNGKVAKILFLVEHKSFQDSDLLRQMLQYQTAIYSQSRTPVLPIVVYHGEERRYRGSLTFHDYLQDFPSFVREPFGKNVLDFTCLFLNIQELDIHKEARGLISAPILFILKEIWRLDEKVLGEFFSLFRGCDQKTREELMKAAVTYITQYDSRFTRGRLVEIEEKYIEVREERSMKAIKNLFDLENEQIHQEGLQKGLETTALRMLENGVDVETICKYTQLTPEEVKRLSQSQSVKK